MKTEAARKRERIAVFNAWLYSDLSYKELGRQLGFNPQRFQYVIGRTISTYWRYLDDEERQTFNDVFDHDNHRELRALKPRIRELKTLVESKGCDE
jgi:hypothetical protein